jgi:hypothetical protein
MATEMCDETTELLDRLHNGTHKRKKGAAVQSLHGRMGLGTACKEETLRKKDVSIVSSGGKNTSLWVEKHCVFTADVRVTKRWKFYVAYSRKPKLHVRLHVPVRCFCQILIKIGLYQQRLAELLGIIFHEKPVSGSRVATWRQLTDRNGENNRRIFAIFRCEDAEK